MANPIKLPTAKKSAAVVKISLKDVPSVKDPTNARHRFFRTIAEPENPNTGDDKAREERLFTLNKDTQSNYSKNAGRLVQASKSNRLS